MDTKEVLKSLEKELETFDHRRIVPLKSDKYIASSVMQKAIRRGQTKFALRAGATLWQHDRASFWRRVHVLSVEDIGIASPDVVVKVLTAYAHAAWRGQNDDLKVGLYLIKIMCEADKTRVCDELLAITGNGVHLKRKREEFFFANENLLVDVITNPKELLPERALALWLLAGTELFCHDNLPTRRGNPKLATEILSHLCSHKPLAFASASVVRRTQWPLALFTALVHESILGSSTCEQTTIIVDTELDDTDVKGIPLTAIDQYTRVGKTVIREMQTKLPELKSFTTRQLGIGIFYTEGHKLDKRLSSPKLDSIHQHAGIADFEGAYGDVPSYMALREILAEHEDLLKSLRERHLKEYFYTQHDELLFAEVE